MSFEALHFNDSRSEINYDGKNHPTLPNSNLLLRMGPRADLQEDLLPTLGTNIEIKKCWRASTTLPPHSWSHAVLRSRQAPLTTQHPIEWWLLLTSSWTSRSQPAFSKIWTTERWPLLAARCRGVRPCCWCKANTDFKTGHQNHTPAQQHSPLPSGVAGHSYGFTQNSSLSPLTLAIGIVINEQNRLKMWRFPLVHNFYSPLIKLTNRKMRGFQGCSYFSHWC